MKKPKKKSISKLKKEADAAFSLYIRTRDSKNGLSICFTCGVMKPISEMQGGHYMPRNHLNTRYDEQNNHTQCVSCNVFKHGNMPVYTIRLMEKYGDDIIKELYRRAREIKQFREADYLELIETYKNKLKDFNS